MASFFITTSSWSVSFSWRIWLHFGFLVFFVLFCFVFLAKRLLLGACFLCRAIIYSIPLSPTLFSLLNGRCYQLFLFIRVDGSYLWASRFVTPGGGSCFFFIHFFFLVWSAREKKNRNKNLLLSVPLRSEPNKKKHTGENTLLRENGFKKKKEIFVLAFDRQFHYSRRLICRPDLPRGIFFLLLLMLSFAFRFTGFLPSFDGGLVPINGDIP